MLRHIWKRVINKTHRDHFVTFSNMVDASAFPVTETITQKLRSHFEPLYLEVINESKNHNVPKNSETHFKVVVVSTKFDGLKLIERHRAVNTLLRDELKTGGVHALSIKAKTPEQWKKNSTVEPSPKCLGGSKK